MTKVYLIMDETAGNINKITDEQGLIEYANDAHFVEKDLNKPINEDYQVYATDSVEGAKSILQADMFYVKEVDFDTEHIVNIDLN